MPVRFLGQPTRFERLGARLFCLVACGAVLAVLQVALRLREQLLRLGEHSRSVLLRSRFLRRTDRLPRVAHLLYRRTHAARQMDADEEPCQRERREHLS